MFQQISLNQVQTQKQALDQLSLTLIKNTFLIGTYMILYIRNVFREEAFVLSRLEDLTVVELLPVNNETDAIIKILSKGVFDAVDKKYVRLLFFEIKDKNDNTLECYKFCFHYKSGEVCMQKLSSLADKRMQVERNPIDYKKNILKRQEKEVEIMKIQPPEDSEIRRMNFLERLANRKAEREKEKEKEKEYTNLKYIEMEQIYKKSLNKKSLTLLTSILNTKGHLNPLPEKAYIMVKMMYYDNTPSDYIPPYFSDLNQDIELQYEEQPMEYTLGEIKTGFHAMKINLQSVCFRSYAPYQTEPETTIKQIKKCEHKEIKTNSKNKEQMLQREKEIEGDKQIEKDMSPKTKTILESKACEPTKHNHKKAKRRRANLFKNKRLGRKKKGIRNKRIKKTHRKKQKQINKPPVESIEHNTLALINERKGAHHNKGKENEMNLNEINASEEKQKGFSLSKKKQKEFEKRKMSEETKKRKQGRQEKDENKRNSKWEEKIQNNKKPKKRKQEDSIYKISNKGKEQIILSNSQTRSFTKRANCSKDLSEGGSTSEEKTTLVNLPNQLQKEQTFLSNQYYIESNENKNNDNEKEDVILIEDVKPTDPDKKENRKRKIENSNKKIKDKKETNQSLKRDTQKKGYMNNKSQTNDAEKKKTHSTQHNDGKRSNNNKDSNKENTECIKNSKDMMKIKETEKRNGNNNIVMEEERSTTMSEQKNSTEKETDKELDKDEDDTTEKMNRIDADMYTLCLNSKYISKLNVCEELGIKKILVNPLIERMKKKGYLTGTYVKNKGYESTLYIPISNYHINNHKQ